MWGYIIKTELFQSIISIAPDFLSPPLRQLAYDLIDENQILTKVEKGDTESAEDFELRLNDIANRIREYEIRIRYPPRAQD